MFSGNPAFPLPDHALSPGAAVQGASFKIPPGSALMQSGMAIYHPCIWWLAISLRLVLVGVGVLSPAVFAAPAAAQDGAVQQRSVAVPGFWDPRRRPERPDLSRLQTIRFLTETDYPPFDYAGPDGNPAGFNRDLALLRVAGS